MERLINLDRIEASKIRARQKSGSMKEYYDNEGYLCYSKEELENWEKRKVGRKPIRDIKFKGNVGDVSQEVQNVIQLCKENNIKTLGELIDYQNRLLGGKE